MGPKQFDCPIHGLTVGYDWCPNCANVKDSATYTTGIKYDSGKPRFELIAPEFLFGLSRVLTFGAAKYEDRNWEKGMKWSRPFGALMRHLWEWWKGNRFDPETGESHLYHAACCLMFLATYEERGTGEDDRP